MRTAAAAGQSRADQLRAKEIVKKLKIEAKMGKAKKIRMVVKKCGAKRGEEKATKDFIKKCRNKKERTSKKLIMKAKMAEEKKTKQVVKNPQTRGC